MNLATQLVASSNFCWLTGMYGFSPKYKAYQRYAFPGIWVDDKGVIWNDSFPDLAPCLTDSRTQGGLLDLVQRAYNAPYAYVKRDAMGGPNTGTDYFVGGLPDLKSVWSSSVGEALSKALLEAP